MISTAPIGPVVTPRVPDLTRAPGQTVSWQAQAATDPDGRDVVWTSPIADGGETTLTINPARGLALGATHWLRLRQRDAGGVWSEWTAWHAPFRTGRTKRQVAKGAKTRREF